MNSNTVGKLSFLEEYSALVQKYRMYIEPGYGDPYITIAKDRVYGDTPYLAQEYIDWHLKDIKDNTDFDTAN